MLFSIQHFSFSSLSYFPKFITDYISGEKYAEHFYKYVPQPASFLQAIHDKSSSKINRKALVEVLKKQYLSVNPQSMIPEHVSKNISLLEQDNTFTLTTGHQLCLLTGPLYFIYKIISVINLAAHLKQKYYGYNFVPVYWMASEDHDFEEINHVHLFGKTVEWKPQEISSNMHRAVGTISTESIVDFLKEVKNILSNSAEAATLFQLFIDAYTGNKNLADATRYLVNALFGEYGLIVLDANDQRLKKEFTTVFQEDILHKTHHRLINSTVRQLEEFSVNPQVIPREINCFYLFPDGTRKRIIESSQGYKIQDTELCFSEKEIIKETEEYPERFSPNVVLRTLYQEKILPDLAYTGGPAEIAYWLECKQMFEYHNINFPVLMLRNACLWLNEQDYRKIQEWNINIEEFFSAPEQLLSRFVNNKLTTDSRIETETETIKAVYTNIIKKAMRADASLRAFAESEMQKQLKALEHIQTKIFRAEKNKQETELNRIRKLKEKLFPHGLPQERHENFIPLYLKHGKEFFNILKNNLSPFDFRLHVSIC